MLGWHSSVVRLILLPVAWMLQCRSLRFSNRSNTTLAWQRGARKTTSGSLRTRQIPREGGDWRRVRPARDKKGVDMAVCTRRKGLSLSLPCFVEKAFNSDTTFTQNRTETLPHASIHQRHDVHFRSLVVDHDLAWSLVLPLFVLPSVDCYLGFRKALRECGASGRNQGVDLSFAS
jgi:hypothetical protein